MALLTGFGGGVGFLYVTDSNATDVISSMANTMTNVKKILLDASTSIALPPTTGSYATTYGRRYFMNTSGGSQGDLTGATEITKGIVQRGLESELPVTSYTIATGVLTPLRDALITVVNVDTQGAAASDDLDTITTTDYATGDLIIFRGAATGRVVTFKNATGNIFLANSLDFATGASTRSITLQYVSGTGFVEISRSPNIELTVDGLRDSGIAFPVGGVGPLTLPTNGTIELTPGVDKMTQVITGSPALIGSVVYQADPTPTTPYLDGDTMTILYRATPTGVGANTVSIFGATLTDTQAEGTGGYVQVQSTYRLSNTTWYSTVIQDTLGEDLATTTDLADYEPELGNPAANGYILSSTTAGVRSWIPDTSGSGNQTVVFADTATRVAATPSFIGQLGVQTDTNTIFKAASLTVGDWVREPVIPYLIATGTDAYSVTNTPPILAYAAGNTFSVYFTNANTAVSTINVDSLGAKSIKKNGSVALIAGDILAGKIYTLIYDGTNFQLSDAGKDNLFQVGAGANSLMTKNATAAAGSGSIAIGLTANATATRGIAIGELAEAGNSASALGILAIASGTSSVSLGDEATSTALKSNALGYQANARIGETTQINGAIITRKDSGEPLADYFFNFAGAVITLTTPEVSLTAVADTTITIPSGCRFYPDEVDLIVTTVDGSITTQPTIRAGITGTLAQYLAAVITTNIGTGTPLYARERKPTLLTNVGCTTITTGITSGAVLNTATVYKGRFVIKGTLLETE